MRIIKLLLPLYFVLFGSGCASFGPTVLIETPEPAEDFVVLCNWIVHPIFDLHGGGKSNKQNVYVAKSGEKVDCGVSLSGGDPAVQVMHPVYLQPEVLDRDGVTVYQYTKTSISMMNDLKHKFANGEWAENKNPSREYLGKFPGCGFPNQYFDYYRQFQAINREYFKGKYSSTILACMEIEYGEISQYDPSSAKQLMKPSERVELLWSAGKWSNSK